MRGITSKIVWGSRELILLSPVFEVNDTSWGINMEVSTAHCMSMLFYYASGRKLG
ncbi:hypothetical protein M378DRAFT_160685 [Amanita muscaria Koide BX008]|uniref:Uncharacterized protein n=1 Tax=Amanita muscaria (strain Koide BX008) TaxID=946122 RepID=A0A0C2STG9_AMAMK|nr:hypothetical protein M378DRAFT_160685 [Amanita muscaria Koide BX008]